MYANDSFFTLGIGGQIGLVLLSLVLTLAIVAAFWVFTKQRNVFVKLGLSVVVLWLFVWLSPQIYYTYYLFLFDSIEAQNVIKSPPTVSKILSLMTFSDRANFSHHGKGLLGWLLIVVSVLGSYRHRHRHRHRPRHHDV